MARKHSLQILLPLLLLAAGGLWLWLRPDEAPPPPPPLRDPTPLNQLHEVGVLEPRLIARILNPINGTLAQVIDDGTRVQKGDLLFRMDEEEIQSRIEEQRDAIDLKLEELETHQGELEVITSTYSSIQARERAELAHAELELSYRAEGLRPEERRLHEISIALAQLDLEDREDRLQRQQDLVRQNFATAASLDAYQRDVASAGALLEERKTQLELESRPMLEEERLTLQSAVDQARDVVERSQRKHQREVAAKSLEIEGVELELKHMREELANRESNLEQVRITAPADGIIRLMRRLHWRTRSWQTLSVGQQSWSLDVLGDLVDPHDLTLRVLIHESDILRVKPGQVVRARLTAYPDVELVGEVKNVTHLGQDRMDLTPIYRQSPPTQQAQFLAEIELDTRDIPAMPGMTATVTIDFGEVQP
ncbi:MAG: HlyD family efflux transporter periplasmic adaptor subunit [Verrucomicrobia bacterium]|nr:HlyD family efflux transporter periplasmic adaptor subunit [Verrucomicrobiota bacterium]